MAYDFNITPERRGTGSLKWDGLAMRYGDANLLPLWVADMDFETPDFILNALRRRLEHANLGYTIDPEDYLPSIIDWQRRLHGWETSAEWISFMPGVVKAIGLAINFFVGPGEKVIVQAPVYHPFFLTAMGNRREVVFNELREDRGRYSMDLEGLERLIDSKCRLLILSNPHNPVGITWDRETLMRLAEICQRHNIVVISDEIHADMALFGNRHIPFASVSDSARDISITLCAPSKTFNIAGLAPAYCIIANQELRSPFYRWIRANELHEPHIFAPIATVAAYREGEEWRREMLAYIEGNVCALEKSLSGVSPFIVPIRPQASFLVWLDCRELNLSQRELIERTQKVAGLALNDGEMFGRGGKGFLRINVGTSRQRVLEAASRLTAIVGG